VWPNCLQYLHPPVEFLGYYNTGISTVPESAMKWFGYNNNQVRTRIKNGKASILLPYPHLVSITNLILFLMLLSYLLLKGWQYSPSFNKSIILAGFVWITNAGFTVFTCPAELRFQTFPVTVTFIFSLLLIDWMVRLTEIMKLQSQQHAPDSQYSKKVSA
jgi:hypothetical protein